MWVLLEHMFRVPTGVGSKSSRVDRCSDASSSCSEPFAEHSSARMDSRGSFWQVWPELPMLQGRSRIRYRRMFYMPFGSVPPAWKPRFVGRGRRFLGRRRCDQTVPRAARLRGIRCLETTIPWPARHRDIRGLENTGSRRPRRTLLPRMRVWLHDFLGSRGFLRVLSLWPPRLCGPRSRL